MTTAVWLRALALLRVVVLIAGASGGRGQPCADAGQRNLCVADRDRFRGHDEEPAARHFIRTSREEAHHHRVITVCECCNFKYRLGRHWMLKSQSVDANWLASRGAAMSKVYVIHENGVWVEPLRKAFDELWDAVRGVVPRPGRPGSASAPAGGRVLQSDERLFPHPRPPLRGRIHRGQCSPGWNATVVSS